MLAEEWPIELRKTEVLSLNEKLFSNLQIFKDDVAALKINIYCLFLFAPEKMVVSLLL